MSKPNPQPSFRQRVIDENYERNTNVWWYFATAMQHRRIASKNQNTQIQIERFEFFWFSPLNDVIQLLENEHPVYKIVAAE